MIVDELLAKFNRIQDLPVSEEMLGAYAEGSVTDSEQMLVSSIADSSPEISALLCEVEDLGEMLTSNSQDLNQNDLMVVSVQELPNVDDYSFADNFKETPFNLETFGAEILDP